MRRRSPTPETRQILAERSRAAWLDPEKRQRMINGLRRGKAAAARLSDGRDQRPLPAMTDDQFRRYRYLRQVIGRDAALAEVLGKKAPKSAKDERRDPLLIALRAST